MPRKSRARRPPSAAFDDRSDARYATGIDAARRSHSGMMTTSRSNGPKIATSAGGSGSESAVATPGVFDRGFWVSACARARGRRGSRRRRRRGGRGRRGGGIVPSDRGELAVVGEESAVVAHLEDEVVERAVQGEAGVADELERAGSAGGAGHRAGGRGVRANLVEALVRRRGGGRANRRRRGRRRRRRAGIRDREADERRHDERARERDERSARGAGGRRRPASQRGGRRAGPIGVSRSTATFNARRAGTRASGSRRSVVRASTSFEDAIEVAVAAVSGGGRRARRRGASPDARREVGGPHRHGTRRKIFECRRLARRGAGPALLCSAELAAARPVSGISSIERWFRSVRIETVRANTTDRPGIVPVSPPAVARPITCCQHITRRGTTAAFLVPRGGRRLVRERGRDIPASRATRDARRYRAGASLPRALSRRTSPSRARAFASPTALSPRPPLPFAAIDPRVVTRPDRRRLARCPPAPRSPPAPGRSARPPRRA